VILCFGFWILFWVSCYAFRIAGITGPKHGDKQDACPTFCG